MDPVSQAVVGCVASQAVFGRKLGRVAAVCGAVGGMAADADVLIRSAQDPLLAMELHRHFTHALAFVPVGGLLAALPFLLVRRWRARWREIVAACTLAYATHAPLDVLTSYGTLYWWPFSRERLALDWLSIVDPLFTVPLAVLVALSACRRQRRYAVAAACLGLAYVGFGGVQHARAGAVQADLAAARGHRVEAARVMPTLGNAVLFRSLYLAGGEIHADAIRVGPMGAVSVVVGRSTPQAGPPAANPLLPAAAAARAARDYRRFAWFADGLVGRDPRRPDVWADLRYSLSPEGFEPLWGVRLGDAGTHWVDLMDGEPRRGLAELWALVTGRSERLREWLI